MNIVLCIIDTLRYDFIRAHGVNNWIETPNLDKLARKSLMFEDTYAASYPTIPHRTDVITGEYGWPGQGPFHPWMPLRFDVPTLPRLLAKAGYATQLIHDTPHLVNGGHAFDWPFAAWSFVRGAEVDRPWIDGQGLTYLDNWAHDALFDFVDEADLHGGIRRLLLTYSRANRGRTSRQDWNAAQLFHGAAEFVRDNADRDNFFLWVDCFDPHEPWDAPPEFVSRYVDDPNFDGRIDPRAFLGTARHAPDGNFPPGVRERQLALYAAKVTWMDHCFGELLDVLEQTGLDERTAIILTADHGTNLGERGGFGKTWIVNEQEAHVPLLISVPQGRTGRCTGIVQPQDIFATILGLAQVELPESCVGYDLLQGSAANREVALAGRSVDNWDDNPDEIICTIFDPPWYLNMAANSKACRLFRLGSVENVRDEHPKVARRLRETGLAALAARGADPQLITWLRSEGTALFPALCVAWPGPPDWHVYWSRVYDETPA